VASVARQQIISRRHRKNWRRGSRIASGGGAA